MHKKITLLVTAFSLIGPTAVLAQDTDVVTPATAAKPPAEYQIAGPDCRITTGGSRCVGFVLNKGTSLEACVREYGGPGPVDCYPVPLPGPPNPPLLHGLEWEMGSQVSCSNSTSGELCFVIIANISGGMKAYCNIKGCVPAK